MSLWCLRVLQLVLFHGSAPLHCHHKLWPLLSPPPCPHQALELVRADSEALLGGVQATANLAQRISAKVRRLDSAVVHVESALELVRLILERTRCVSGVQDALVRQDYEAAAVFVSTFLKLEAQLSPAARSLDSAGQVEEQRQVINQQRRALACLQCCAHNKAVLICLHAHFAELQWPELSLCRALSGPGLQQLGQLQLA